MSAQRDISAIPTAVLEFHGRGNTDNSEARPQRPQESANRAGAQPQPLAPFTADGRYPSHPAGYRHGYSTPPLASHRTTLSSPVPHTHPQRSQSTSSGHVQAWSGGHPTQFTSPYPTPPTRPTPLVPPDQQQCSSISYQHMAPAVSVPHHQQPPAPPPSVPSQRPNFPDQTPHPQGQSFSLSLPPPTLPSPSQGSNPLRRPSGSQSHITPPPPLSLPQPHSVPHSYPSTSLRPLPAPTESQASQPITTAMSASEVDRAVHVQYLEARLKWLGDMLVFSETDRKRINDEANAAMTELHARLTRRAQDGARVAAANVRLAEENARLRRERDEARAAVHVRGEACHMLQGQLAAAAAETGRALQNAAKEHEQVRRRDQEVLAGAQHQVKSLQRGVANAMQKARVLVEQLVRERDALAARLAKVGEGGSGEHASEQEGQMKPEPDLTPKSEPLDELELQYPPDMPEPAPIASSSVLPVAPTVGSSWSSVFPMAATSSAVPPAAPTAPSSIASLLPTDAPTSGSAFFTWDPPPDPGPDRKRRRVEYEAADDAAVSLGPAFPIPRQIDVKMLNSPVHWFMEIRRKAEGGG
ncbi:hypothetical protein DFH07DRAFT_88576 [Mycena maculata]|uniref:Uncharacterized protein n=1 Tax=Mycena maculata TaxID=230809 RepID=A0AAD7K2I2_9AGAR|nr:hypothetical protein DFH07DRAFT_88576 [Mycena maculata]